MNYQQGPQFFTEGVGNNAPNQNPLSEIENLNADTWNTAKEALPNNVPAESEASPEKTGQQTMVELTPPPAENLDAGILAPEKEVPTTSTSPDLKDARITDGRLTGGSLKAVKEAEASFMATGDADAFYDSMRQEAMQKTLENSFGRKLGA